MLTKKGIQFAFPAPPESMIIQQALTVALGAWQDFGQESRQLHADSAQLVNTALQPHYHAKAARQIMYQQITNPPASNAT